MSLSGFLVSLIVELNFVYLTLGFASQDDVRVANFTKRRAESGITRDGEKDWLVKYPTYITTFPYIVSIKVGSSKKAYYCTGTFFSVSNVKPKHVLTTASCFLNNNKGIRSFVGSKNVTLRFGSDSRTEGGVESKVESIYYHPEFMGTCQPHEYDLAIVKAKNEIAESSHIKAAFLYDYALDTQEKDLQKYAQERTECKVLSHDPSLKYIITAINKRQSCDEHNSRMTSRSVDLICLKDHSACEQNSGSPLICDYNEHGILGVLSYIKCPATDSAVVTLVDRRTKFTEQALAGRIPAGPEEDQPVGTWGTAGGASAAAGGGGGGAGGAGLDEETSGGKASSLPSAFLGAIYGLQLFIEMVKMNSLNTKIGFLTA